MSKLTIQEKAHAAGACKGCEHLGTDDCAWLCNYVDARVVDQFLDEIEVGKKITSLDNDIQFKVRRDGVYSGVTITPTLEIQYKWWRDHVYPINGTPNDVYLIGMNPKICKCCGIDEVTGMDELSQDGDRIIIYPGIMCDDCIKRFERFAFIIQLCHICGAAIKPGPLYWFPYNTDNQHYYCIPCNEIIRSQWQSEPGTNTGGQEVNNDTGRNKATAQKNQEFLR